MAIFGGGHTMGAVGAVMSLMGAIGAVTFDPSDFGAEVNKLLFDVFAGGGALTWRSHEDVARSLVDRAKNYEYVDIGRSYRRFNKLDFHDVALLHVAGKLGVDRSRLLRISEMLSEVFVNGVLMLFSCVVFCFLVYCACRKDRRYLAFLVL